MIVAAQGPLRAKRAKSRFWYRLLPQMLPLLLSLASAAAQTSTGELRLTVRDASGAGFAATAELANQATRTMQRVTLSAHGKYSFKALPAGLYRLTITHPGFQSSSELIEIRPDVPREHIVTLNVAQQQAAVEVKESETLLNRDRIGAAYYVGSQEITERPLQLAGRGLIDLISEQPGWTLEANGTLHPRESEYDTQFVVDGFPTLENRSPAFLRPTGADDVQALKIYTSGIPAEFGNRVGGVVEVTTSRNTSPGFHATAIAGGGSFGAASGYLSTQYVRGETTATISAEAFETDRYLDPAVPENYANHASSTALTGTIEHDFSDTDRLRVSGYHQETWFLVPNDYLQQTAGQRQDRTGANTEGRISYQHVFSPWLIGSLRGSVRDVEAKLWSNPLSTPIAAVQDRGFRESYLDASVAGHLSRHDWKAGVTARYASIREEFDYQIRAYRLLGERIFDRELPPSFFFNERHPDREQAAYVQDQMRLGPVSISAGLRFDHYNLLVDETGWSPRLGAAWYLKPAGLLVHAAYDRVFGTPPFENILLSASPATRLENGFYLPLRPARGNYYETGFTKALNQRIRLDASYFAREVNNFQDDDLLLNTGVSFPISFQHARIRGEEVKLEVPHWGKFSGFVSYSNTTGIGQFPISGGLFLDDSDTALLNSHGKFPVTQDVRNVAHARIRCQVLPRLWTAWGANYGSGLPVEDADSLPSESFLVAEYGTAVLQKMNLDRGRVRPSFSLDASVGVDLWKSENHKVAFQADAFNLTDRLNLINFAGLLSGTAIAPPRSFSLHMRAEF
jgi:Carboxypeptidase regulatory-like domain